MPISPALQQRIPNYLTWARVVAIPLIALFMLLPGSLAKACAVLLFIAVALTDWLDGYLARKWSMQSDFGAFLDPVADKLLVAVLLILLMLRYPVGALIVSVIIIISREIVISALREWMAGQGQRETVKVSALGKVKTTLQMIAILFLLMATQGDIFYLIGLFTLYAAALATLVSMVEYLRAAFRS